MRDLSAHLRHLFVVQTLGDVPDSFSVTAEHTDRLASQAERLSQGEIVRAIEFLATAIAAVKDGSDPRIQLELALLKTTQPQADLSLQALMFRIEQLEGRMGGEAAPPAAGEEVVEEPESGTAPPARTAGGRGSGASAAAAPAVAQPSEQPEAALELGQIQALWPGVAQAVREENAMLGAALGEARPHALEGSRLTVAFPEEKAFSKKKVEANRELVERVVRGLTGQPLSIGYELNGEAAPAAQATLSEDELIARLKEELGAEEVFDDEEGEP
jgi:DNA polymerase-3 subunit gamma/tau